MANNLGSLKETNTTDSKCLFSPFQSYHHKGCEPRFLEFSNHVDQNGKSLLQMFRKGRKIKQVQKKKKKRERQNATPFVQLTFLLILFDNDGTENSVFSNKPIRRTPREEKRAETF